MTRLRLALAAVIVAALLPAGGVFLTVASNPAVLLRGGDDQMSIFERRLAPLREALRGETVVGYLAPTQVVDRTAHLYSVRYAVAPVRVLRKLDLPLVIADQVADVQRLPPQLRVRRDFGQGVLLLEQAPR